MSDDDRHHPVVFVTIAVPDLGAGRSFYEAALGWETVEVPAPDRSHVVMIRCHTGAKPNVGLVEGVPGGSGTSPFLLTDDLATSGPRWRSAGGSLGATALFAGLGVRCEATDPWGNTVVLWQWAPGQGWTP